MRTLLLALLIAVSGAVAAEPPAVVEPTLPQMQKARGWLEIIDAGHYEQAWNEAHESLRKKANLDKWTKDVTRMRAGGAVKCRRSLDFELLDDGVKTLFITEFADGRSISERVTLVEDADGNAHIAKYVTGPAIPDRGPACQ